MTVEEWDSDSELELQSNGTEDGDKEDQPASEDEYDNEDDIYNLDLSACIQLQAAFMREVAALGKFKSLIVYP